MFTEEDFSQRLSELRIQKGVSAREMSLAIGLNPGYIQNIESGKAAPSLENFLYICEYLKISPSEFFDIQNKEPGKLQDIITELKRLDTARLETVYAVVKEFSKK